jgi:hypothetical protein
MSDDATQTTEATVEQPAAPSLQLSDLVLALQTIQAFAQRGVIRADEMSTVGGLHDRLFAFLEAQGAIARQAPATATPAEPAGE